MATVSRRLSHASPEFVFKLVGQFSPCLSLDIGAAMGTVAKQMQQASPQGRTVCFEPWKGNIPYFHEITAGVGGITLVEKAVSDFDGPGVFFVPSVVQGHEKGWGKRPGYSSTGMLIPAAEAAGKPGEKVFTVDVCSIDRVVDERVRLMKIDVQGGEGAVLRGARKLIDRGLVDMLFVEFQGEEDVIAFANAHDYAIFDIEYNAIPVGVKPENLGFRLGYRELPLSNGSTAIRGEIDGLPRDPQQLAEFMTAWRPLKGYIWTDLVLVRRGFLDEFNAGLDRLGCPKD